MTDPTLNDTQLQSLEARLTATVFQLPLVRQQELLYRCAFRRRTKRSAQSNPTLEDGRKHVRRSFLDSRGHAGVRSLDARSAGP